MSFRILCDLCQFVSVISTTLFHLSKVLAPNATMWSDSCTTIAIKAEQGDFQDLKALSTARCKTICKRTMKSYWGPISSLPSPTHSHHHHHLIHHIPNNPPHYRPHHRLRHHPRPHVTRSSESRRGRPTTATLVATNKVSLPKTSNWLQANSWDKLY